jgi:uncharacterized ParB-like nuclease family protein
VLFQQAQAEVTLFFQVLRPLAEVRDQEQVAALLVALVVVCATKEAGLRLLVVRQHQDKVMLAVMR